MTEISTSNFKIDIVCDSELDEKKITFFTLYMKSERIIYYLLRVSQDSHRLRVGRLHT